MADDMVDQVLAAMGDEVEDDVDGIDEIDEPVPAGDLRGDGEPVDESPVDEEPIDEEGVTCFAADGETPVDRGHVDIGRYRRDPIIGPLGPSPLLTYASVCCAVLSVLSSLMGLPRIAVVLVVACGILDAFDGRFAGMFDCDEDALRFGIEVDSLSDAVAFGIAPAATTMSVALSAGNPVAVGVAVAGSCLYMVSATHRLAWYGTLASSGRSPAGFRGVPVTYSALAFVATYLACVANHLPRLEVACALVACEILMAVLFVLNVAVPRPKTRTLAILAMAGVAMSIALLAL